MTLPISGAYTSSSNGRASPLPTLEDLMDFILQGGSETLAIKFFNQIKFDAASTDFIPILSVSASRGHYALLSQILDFVPSDKSQATLNHPVLSFFLINSFGGLPLNLCKKLDQLGWAPQNFNIPDRAPQYFNTQGQPGVTLLQKLARNGDGDGAFFFSIVERIGIENIHLSRNFDRTELERCMDLSGNQQLSKLPTTAIPYITQHGCTLTIQGHKNKDVDVLHGVTVERALGHFNGKSDENPYPFPLSRYSNEKPSNTSSSDGLGQDTTLGLASLQDPTTTFHDVQMEDVIAALQDITATFHNLQVEDVIALLRDFHTTFQWPTGLSRSSNKFQRGEAIGDSPASTVQGMSIPSSSGDSLQRDDITADLHTAFQKPKVFSKSSNRFQREEAIGDSPASTVQGMSIPSSSGDSLQRDDITADLHTTFQEQKVLSRSSNRFQREEAIDDSSASTAQRLSIPSSSGDSFQIEGTTASLPDPTAMFHRLYSSGDSLQTDDITADLHTTFQEPKVFSKSSNRFQREEAIDDSSASTAQRLSIPSSSGDSLQVEGTTASLPDPTAMFHRLYSSGDSLQIEDTTALLQDPAVISGRTNATANAASNFSRTPSFAPPQPLSENEVGLTPIDPLAKTHVWMNIHIGPGHGLLSLQNPETGKFHNLGLYPVERGLPIREYVKGVSCHIVDDTNDFMVNEGLNLDIAINNLIPRERAERVIQHIENVQRNCKLGIEEFRLDDNCIDFTQSAFEAAEIPNQPNFGQYLLPSDFSRHLTGQNPVGIQYAMLKSYGLVPVLAANILSQETMRSIDRPLQTIGQYHHSTIVGVLTTGVTLYISYRLAKKCWQAVQFCFNPYPQNAMIELAGQIRELKQSGRDCGEQMATLLQGIERLGEVEQNDLDQDRVAEIRMAYDCLRKTWNHLSIEIQFLDLPRRVSKSYGRELVRTVDDLREQLDRFSPLITSLSERLSPVNA